MKSKKQTAAHWFKQLRNAIRSEFEAIEAEYLKNENALLAHTSDSTFEVTPWQRDGGGGGEMSVMKGNVFEKVGVNISTVEGEFSEIMRKEIPGADKDPRFWASGISLVAHMRSPLVPAVHMNTRMIVVGADDKSTQSNWFGGGADLTPMFENDEDTSTFHAALKAACDATDANYYPKYKKWCDEYFYLPHRDEPRGVGGIFYDRLNTGHWDSDFAFTQAVGCVLRDCYPAIVRRHMHTPWTEEQREHQLYKRGRYVEFNLLHDRGTRFGLQTGGNIDAILMSLPPEAKWK